MILPQTHSKIVDINTAVNAIPSNANVATAGFVGIGIPEYIYIALAKKYIETQLPKNLTLIYAAGQGDGKEQGLNNLAYEGLVSRVIGGHWGLVPKLGKLVMENKIQGYNLPQGVISHLFRDIAAGKPAQISKVGLRTFVDPRLSGGKLNSITTEDLVSLININDKEYLLYKTLPINIGIIRGSIADSDGNISMRHEALTTEALAIAMAAKNSGGIVIVQVERLAQKGTINAREVEIPGIFVDYVVVCDTPNQHMQTLATKYSASFSGETKVPLSTLKALPFSERKIIARRAAFELKPNQIINLGIGMPEGISRVAAVKRDYWII